MMRLVLVLLVVAGCKFGDNNVHELDGGADAPVTFPPADECCLFWPLGGDAIRECVAERTPAYTCRRLNCVVWDEWVCPNGSTARSTWRADGVTVCDCGGMAP